MSKAVVTTIQKTLCVWALLSCVAPLWAANRGRSDCSLQKLAALDIIVKDQILVPLDYRGQTVWMALDLAQPMSLLSPRAVDPLKLTVRKIDARPGEFMLNVNGKP